MEHDAWFFVGVFVFIFIIWIATGGPLHQISFTGPRLALPDTLGGGTYISFPRASFGTGTSHVSLPGSSNDGTAVTQSLGGSVFGISSPYRELVSLRHYVSGAESADARNESVEISIPSNAGQSVNISGWRFVSEATGITTAIPGGTAIPISGIVNQMQNIVLAPGERAMIISGRSPIGTSFRENKCIGYLGSFQRFSPQLPQNCPLQSDELVSFYGAYYVRDPTCIDYVRTLSRCQVDLSRPATLSNACRDFMLKYFNYNGCVAAHQNDADFNGKRWRVYLGRTSPMWRKKHEVVKLLDTDFKTVDAFSY
jgi:hypothetical protein